MTDSTNDISAFLTNWTSAERSGDTAVLDSLLTDDFAGVGPLGFVLPKAAWVGRPQSGDLVCETFDLEELETHPHGAQIVMVTAHATVATAVQAMRHGAFDFIEKPFSVDQIESLVRIVVEGHRR